jgi:hypothetical protein
MPRTSHSRQLLVILALSSWAAGGCRDLDVVTASYATLAEAERAGAVARGWLPPGLPAGTHDIREAHGVDTGRRWALFSFRGEDDAALKRVLQPGETSLEGEVCDAPARLEWWPILLRGQLDAERIRATGLQTYRSADTSLIFAVNWKQRRAYYWTPASRGGP